LQLIDTHCHLNMAEFDGDRQEVIRRATAAGVEFILDIGTDVVSSRKAADSSKVHPSVFAAVGVHPHEASKISPLDLQTIGSLLDDPKAVALGEIGLDYHYQFSPPETQKSLFRNQIDIGMTRGKPLIIHVREAMSDAMQILKEAECSRFRGVFHCFAGSAEDVPLLLEMGFYFSFTGVVTFRNFGKQDVVTSVPLNRLLLETDAPYMTPVPLRGKRNEPAMLIHTARRLAEIYAVPVETLVSQTTANAKALFGLG
jgi:TatD DNase family protein